MATVTTTPYGTYTHGRPATSHGASYARQYVRLDAWTPFRKDAEAGHDRILCAGTTDDSAIHQHGYDASCSCCWLNIAHTSALHAQRIQKAQR